jgi:hypothetical protein
MNKASLIAILKVVPFSLLADETTTIGGVPVMNLRVRYYFGGIFFNSFLKVNIYNKLFMPKLG